jgi:hypothetical protein
VGENFGLTSGFEPGRVKHVWTDALTAELSELGIFKHINFFISFHSKVASQKKDHHLSFFPFALSFNLITQKKSICGAKGRVSRYTLSPRTYPGKYSMSQTMGVHTLQLGCSFYSSISASDDILISSTHEPKIKIKINKLFVPVIISISNRSQPMNKICFQSRGQT